MKVKNILIPVIAIMSFLTSCSPTQEDLVVEKVKENMKDPSSFELIKVELVDTLRLSDKINDNFIVWEQGFQEYIDKSNEHIKWARIYSSSSNIQRELNLAKVALDVSKKIKTKMDSIQTEYNNIVKTPQDTVVSYKYMVRCYGNNSYGAKVMNDIYAWVDVNGNIKLN